MAVPASTSFADIVTALRQEAMVSQTDWAEDADLEGWILAGMRLGASEMNAAGWNYTLGNDAASVVPGLTMVDAWSNLFLSAILFRAAQGGALVATFENQGMEAQGGLSVQGASIADQMRLTSALYQKRWEAAKAGVLGYQTFVMAQV